MDITSVLKIFLMFSLIFALLVKFGLLFLFSPNFPHCLV